ncbi:aldehyde dehydrogenase family protein [Nocardia africana]
MTSTATPPLEAPHVPKSELERLVSLQRAAYLKEGIATSETRIGRIDRLLLAVLEHLDEIATTLGEEYGRRPQALTKALDVLPSVAAAQELRDNIETWMKPERLPGGFVQKKPLGVVGVVGAWNFPLELTIHPAIDALAAGNRVIIKFPDHHPRTGALLAGAVAKYLSPDEVSVVVGDLETARLFSELQLDHLVFTGSPTIGKKVAEAAGRNLVPTTLELGGKNPVVVAKDADLSLAAHRIAGTRLLNGGQICLCPDYVFVPRELSREFADRMVAEFEAFFPDYSTSGGVVSIVDQRNYDRVIGLIDDAVSRGAHKVTLKTASPVSGADPERRVAPTLLLDVPVDAAITDEEIFGPVLPVHLYDSLDEVTDYISSRPAPLGAYWFGPQDSAFEQFLTSTTSGGVTVNDAIAHAFLPGAPFGGVGNSGSGAYHGKAGFDRFTHMRTVAVVDSPTGISDGLVGSTLDSHDFVSAIESNVSAALTDLRARVNRHG